MNSWHKKKFPDFLNSGRASTGSVEVVGLPGFHALPNSITSEPSVARNSANRGAKLDNHDT
jgi:hypothetical protein